MAKLVLQDDILKKIKARPFLIAEIATVMEISTSYLLRLIRENDVSLTQASVLALIKKDFKIKHDCEILTNERLEKAVA